MPVVTPRHCLLLTSGQSVKNKRSKTAAPAAKKARLKSEPGEEGEDVTAAVGSRDATLGLFRAVGKIMYAKREFVGKTGT